MPNKRKREALGGPPNPPHIVRARKAIQEGYMREMAIRLRFTSPVSSNHFRLKSSSCTNGKDGVLHLCLALVKTQTYGVFIGRVSSAMPLRLLGG